MKFTFSEGLKIDLGQFGPRCALCMGMFKAGEEATFGADFPLWVHRKCYSEMKEKQHEIDTRSNGFVCIQQCGAGR